MSFAETSIETMHVYFVFFQHIKINKRLKLPFKLAVVPRKREYLELPFRFRVVALICSELENKCNMILILLRSFEVNVLAA